MQTVVLTTAAAARATERFLPELQAGLAALDAGQLCLQRATGMGGRIEPDSISVSILSVTDSTDHPVIRVGVFFNEVVGGCNCHDDPVASPAYCERIVSLDAVTGQAWISNVTEV